MAPSLLYESCQRLDHLAVHPAFVIQDHTRYVVHGFAKDITPSLRSSRVPTLTDELNYGLTV